MLVTLRERDHISQKHLAELLFVSPPAVCKWEKGENLPSRELRIRIAEIFSVSANEIEYPEYLLRKLSMDPMTSAILEVPSADSPTGSAENKINDALPEIEQAGGKSTTVNCIKRACIALSAIALITLAVNFVLFINRKSEQDENGPQIEESFDRYINDSSWGNIYDMVYIVDVLPDYEWMEAYGKEQLPYLLEADLGVDVVRFSYYDDLNEVSETVNDNGVYYYILLNIITSNCKWRTPTAALRS